MHLSVTKALAFILIAALACWDGARSSALSKDADNGTVVAVVIPIDSDSCKDCKSSAYELEQPKETGSRKGSTVTVTLDAQVAGNVITSGGTAYQIRTATYNGKLVGPLIRVRKGDELHITVKNRLCWDLCREAPPVMAPDFPHDFCITNLHTHGLHVSPSDPADNVYLQIAEGDSHTFKYTILPNHPAGTFWYHPHKHGAVAIQLVGGMSGPLIVEGDLDSIDAIKKMEDRVMMLEQIHVTETATGVMQPNPNDIYDKWGDQLASTAASSRRSLRSLKTLEPKPRKRAAADPPQPTTFHLINGQYAPTITIRPKAIERWRFIHAGDDDGINLAVIKDCADPTPATLDLEEIAIDGLPRGKRITRQSYLMYPGYRWEVLFQAPDKPGSYYLINESIPAWQSLTGKITSRVCLAKIKVDGKPVTDAEWPSDQQLKDVVPAVLNAPITDSDVGNRKWNLKFDFPTKSVDPNTNKPQSHLFINEEEFDAGRVDRFVRLGTAEEWRLETAPAGNNNAGHPFHIHVNPFQHLVFQSSLSTLFPLKRAGGTGATLSTKLTDLAFPDLNPIPASYKSGDVIMLTGTLLNGSSFTIPLTIQDDSTVKSLIDVINGTLNPPPTTNFTVRLDSSGHIIVMPKNDPSLGGLQIQDASDTSRFQFFRNRTVVDRIWRDTLLVPTGQSEIVRMRFLDWAGLTVLHCHIVDHEDQGMMKNIMILQSDVQAQPQRRGAAKVRISTTPVNAPEFRLPDASGKLHGSEEFFGQPLVLVFFRGLGCSHCAAQLQSFANIADRLTSVGARLLAISTETREQLAESFVDYPKLAKLPFIVLADGDQKTFRRYNCFAQDPMHGTFVINAERIVRFSAVGESPFTDVDRILGEVSRIAGRPQ
jgi:FtsP/CotA-like multicopper oxidase with cupredoxin domain/peroxiredoxin